MFLGAKQRYEIRQYLHSQDASFELVSRVMKFVEYKLEPGQGCQRCQLPRWTPRFRWLRFVFFFLRGCWRLIIQQEIVLLLGVTFEGLKSH